ncbi:hypothetical protein JCM1840_006268 [Sporobolomyces johnsonii]
MTVPSSAPKAIDLSHHLSSLSKSRHLSPLKDIFKYMKHEGMISLAGGLPHPSLFPFTEASIKAYPADAELSVDGPLPSNPVSLSIPKFASKTATTDLETCLQYSTAEGLQPLHDFAYRFTTEVLQPAYGDYQILMNNGNTDAWTKVVRLLCENDDTVLVEAATFPSAQAMWIPMGIKAAPVEMDEYGLRSDDLERVLSTWENEHAGKKKPRLLYIVPVGSNPTGSTMPAHRRQEIYNICVQHDVIICEDDPYYCLQYPTYLLGDQPTSAEASTPEEYKHSLSPSFLQFDYQGRVIRLDTFSKTLAPGNRLGYFIANPLFTERLMRATEVESQSPSGWSQGIISELLQAWGIDGYLTWLSNLRDQYETRRNWMCDAVASSFVARPPSFSSIPVASTSICLYPANSSPSPDTLPLFSFVPPTGGMFLWCRFYLAGAPRFTELEAQKDVEDPEETFMKELWEALADNLILLTPGSYYTPWQGADKQTTRARGAETKIGYFRLAFSMANKEGMEEGIRRIEQVLKRVWGY